jgi:peptidase E
VRILALGGHEFSRRRGNEALRDYMLDLVEADRPRICLLPTASGDTREQIAAFRQSLGNADCRVSELSLFRLEGGRAALQAHLMRQDIIYVGGGSMINMLAVWRAHDIHRILFEASRNGTVLCGQSAGAMCWFEWGITRSTGVARPARGLGLLPGSLSVHHHRDPDRRRAMLQAVSLVIPPGFGVDDQAGLLFEGGEVAEIVSARPGAGVWRVESAGGGRWTEARLPARRLCDPRPAIDEPDAHVAELRDTVAARSGMPRRARH